MTTTVDARGLPCPQPVILTRNALQESDAVTTIVDNETAQQNVTRMAEKAGCQVQAEKREEGMGEISNMYAIAEAWLRAGKVVNLPRPVRF